MTEDSVRFCPACKLVYRPDPRIHKDPHTFCPKCGKRLIQETQGDSKGVEQCQRK